MHSNIHSNIQEC